MRCRHCGIRFFTDPRNAHRENLGCPFGCRDHLRKQLANRRSVKYYGTVEGKRRKKLRNAQRNLRVDCAASDNGTRHDDLAREVSSDHSCEVAADSSPQTPGEMAAAAVTWPTGALVRRREAPASGVETGTETDRGFPVVSPDAQRAKPCVAEAQHESVSVEHLDEMPWKGELPLGVLVLDEASVVRSPMLSYLAMVASLIEGRSIGEDELVDALLKMMRQRSMDGLTRNQYVLRFLNQHPP